MEEVEVNVRKGSALNVWVHTSNIPSRKRESYDVLQKSVMAIMYDQQSQNSPNCSPNMIDVFSRGFLMSNTWRFPRRWSRIRS
jgi:hypothetical protein